MAEQERKVILKVETGESQKTVKGLKQDISDLKDAILNLEQGTDEYNDAVKQLQDAQRDLNRVQSLTKESAVALEGSYDALVHQMSLLKKEWRATNDEARRNELGKQIDEINDQLKEFDSSVGNFQRNVGNYESALNGLNTEQQSFGERMSAMQQQIEPTKMKFESIGNIASGVASGFAAAQGAMALLGIESEDFQKTMIKLQGAMALAQGIGGLSGLVEGIGKAKVAFQGLDTGIKTVNKTMGKTGWLAVILLVITAVATLVGHLVKKSKAITDSTSALREYNKVGRESITTVSDEILKVKMLEQVATDAAIAEEHRTAAAQELLKIMGKEITDTNTLAVKNGDLKKEIDGVTASMIKQAMAAAQMEKLQELYKNYLTIQNEGPNWGDKWGDSMWASGGGAVIQGVVAAINDGTKTYNDRLEEAKTAYEEYAKTLKGNTDAAELLKALGITESQKKPNGGGGSGKETPEEMRDRLVAEASARLWEDIENMVIEDVEIPDIEPKALPDEKVKLGQNAQFAKGDIDYNDRVLQRELAKNEILEQTDKERYERQNELLLANEQKKLDILKEYQQKAIDEGDWQSQLALQQDIADQEVAIQVEKNRQIVEAEERRKEKQIQIMNDVASALSAAGAVMDGITAIYEESAKQDGEVTEAEAKKLKNLQYASATINMLQGAISAFAAAQSIPPPFGQILGAANAAAVIAMGTANLMKIKNTDLTGSSSSGTGAFAPNIGSYSSELPASYTRNITTSSEVDELNKDTRVYILESDIQESNRKVSVRENESSF